MSETNDNRKKPNKSIEQVAREVGRYDLQAYYFVFETIEWLMSKLGERRHVSGAELSRAIRDHAVERFGLLAQHVLASWGVTCTADYGRIVYALIESGQMSRTDQDSLADFDAVYDFNQAFKTYESPDWVGQTEEA